MADFIEMLVNKLSQILLGSIAIEYGISLWQERKFSKKKLMALILIFYGVREILFFLKYR